MLPCSVRRVASAAPQSPILSAFASAVPRAAATRVNLSYRPAQRRRYSSSKPSKDNGSEALPVRQSVQPSAESKTSEAKSSGEKRRRKTNVTSETQKLPSVPSTHNIPKDSLALSSFFSLHRPISVTHSLPRIITDDAFAAIFGPRTKAQRSSEIINTLSQTVEELEQPMASLSLQDDADLHRSDGGVHKIDLRHSDGTETGLNLQVNAMSGQFLPYRAPPLPQPESAMTRGTASAAGMADMAAMAEDEHRPQTRVYKAVFTIEESTDASGEVKIVAHSPELIEERSRERVHRAGPGELRSFLQRMAHRQLRHEEALIRQEEERREGDDSMLAISVKRQRKLKMNKKKHKKLMKRQRHERRKQGR